MSEWIDLADNCDKFLRVEGMPEGSCWSCRHFWQWNSKKWTCEFQEKETKRKMLSAITYKGQQVLTVSLNCQK